MKKKNRQILRGYSEKSQPVAKPVHIQLEETIAERKRLVAKWEQKFLAGDSGAENDIHSQLAKTITEYKKEKHWWNQRLFATVTDKPDFSTKKQAA